MITYYTVTENPKGCFETSSIDEMKKFVAQAKKFGENLEVFCSAFNGRVNYKVCPTVFKEAA